MFPGPVVARLSTDALRSVACDTVGAVKCILKQSDPFKTKPRHLCTRHTPLIQDSRSTKELSQPKKNEWASWKVTLDLNLEEGTAVLPEGAGAGQGCHSQRAKQAPSTEANGRGVFGESRGS